MQPEHPGSREMYDFIADFIAPDFAFSKKDVWHRFGMLGVFGDYVLSCTQGAVLEIGTGESSIYLTAIAKKYGRDIFHCDASPSKILNPLTIPGVFMDDYTYWEEKDPIPSKIKACALYAGPSDKLFAMGILPHLALAFIDGDHIYEQAKLDFWNAYQLMVPNGYIILHDTSPPDESYLSEHRCGGVYRLRQEIEKNDAFDCITLPVGAAMGVGLTIARCRVPGRPEYQA